MKRKHLKLAKTAAKINKAFKAMSKHIPKDSDIDAYIRHVNAMENIEANTDEEIQGMLNLKDIDGFKKAKKRAELLKEAREL